MHILLSALFFALFLYILWLLFDLVGDMAVARDHNPWPWWIISVIWSPFASIFILWLFFDKVNDNPGDGS